MRNIVLIGAGNIGSRTLQSLAKYSRGEPLKVWLVDPDTEALALSEQRANQVNGHKLNIVTHIDMSSLPKICDFAVISTTARSRMNILSALLNICVPKRLLLEKFLFQHKDNYVEAECLFRKHGIKPFVNCPRPAWPGYFELREMVASDPQIDMRVSGANWALASNAIHFVALFDFMTGSMSVSFDGSKLDPEPVMNKRAGYMDVKGEISTKTPRGDCLSLMSWPEGSGDIIVHVRTKSLHAIINEACNKISIQKDGVWEQRTFEVLFASQMEASLSAILNDKPCFLPRYSEIAPAHLALMPAFNMVFFGSRTSKKSCPIT